MYRADFGSVRAVSEAAAVHLVDELGITHADDKDSIVELATRTMKLKRNMVKERRSSSRMSWKKRNSRDDHSVLDVLKLWKTRGDG
jgi:hypothetical protein